MENRYINVCKDCIYFSQHYIKYGGEFIPIEYGSCMCPQLDGKKDGSSACTTAATFTSKKTINFSPARGQAVRGRAYFSATTQKVKFALQNL